MLTYVYRCSHCLKEIEVEQSINEEPLKQCEVCLTDTLERVIQPAGGFRIYGKGVYRQTTRFE